MNFRMRLLAAGGVIAALVACTSMPAEYGVTPASRSTLPAAPPPPGLPPESAYLTPTAPSPAPAPPPSSAAPTILLAQASSPDSALAAPYIGRTWRWQYSLFSDGKRVTPDAPERYTVQFAPDGRVGVRADCNRGSGSYVRGPEVPQIAIIQVATTKMGCPPGSQGSEFLRQLDMVNGWLVDKGDLVLMFKFDSGTMRLRAE